MNYLVHLYLSDPDPDCRLGNLMGDFVKGKLGNDWPPRILRGLEQHRRVDVFAHHHPAFLRSKRRIDDRFGCCKPVLVDIFYDHFLARNWERHAPARLEVFSAEIYRLLEDNLERLPAGLREIAPRMIAHDWLGSYRHQAVIGRVLERLSQRLRHANPIAGGLAELERNYQDLGEDFEEFLEDAKKSR